MKRALLILTVLSLLVAFSMPSLADSHCMDELGCVEVGPDDPIVVGAMLSVSGATSFYGEDSLGGIELAISGRDGMLLDARSSWSLKTACVPLKAVKPPRNV